MEALKARRHRLGAWLASLLVAWVLVIPLQRLDASLFDFFGRLNHAPAAEDLVLVDLDESSLTMFGPWPWPRSLMARLSERLADAGAAKQIWDINFSTARAGDVALDKALSLSSVTVGVIPVIDPAVDSPPVIGLSGGGGATDLCGQDSPFPAARGRLGLSESLAGALAQVGHLTPVLERDGRLRRLPAVICDNGRPVLTLALAGYSAKAGGARLERNWAPWQSAWTLVLGELRIPLDETGAIPLQFGTRLEDYTVYPVHHVLSEDFTKHALKGKTVLLGATALGIGDRIATVHSPNTPGVAVHAELYNRLASERFVLKPASPAGVSLMLVLLATLPAVFINRRGLTLGLTAGSLLLVAFSLYVGYLLSPMVVLGGHVFAITAGLLMQYHEERQMRREHEQRLAALLPSQLFEQIRDSDPNDLIAAQRGRVGVVHARIRNFDRFAIQAPPEITLATLHALAHLAQEVAQRHGAEVYPGENADYLLVWTDSTIERLGSHMVAAAREMHQEAAGLLTPLPANPPLALAAGLHIDDALEGFIGRRDRRRPVLYGPATHIAQQLLPLSEELAAPLMFTHNVAEYLPEDEKRLLGSFKLVDIRKPIDLYCAPGTVDPIDGLRLVA